MLEFPQVMHVENKDSFRQMYIRRVTCYLRQSIYEHVISEKENNYFSVDVFMRTHKIHDESEIASILSGVMSELRDLGWKCKLSFGGTGLFIYSSEKPPPSCWDDDL